MKIYDIRYNMLDMDMNPYIPLSEHLVVLAEKDKLIAEKDKEIERLKEEKVWSNNGLIEEDKQEKIQKRHWTFFISTTISGKEKQDEH